MRILLADDHALFRKGVKALLASRPEYCVVGEAADGCETIELAHQLRPDLIFMDIDMPKLNGLEATRAIKRAIPSIQIIILTVSDYSAPLFEAVKCGVSGYLLKNLEPEEIFQMLEKIQRGVPAINGILATKILSEFSRQAQLGHPLSKDDQLTGREIEVLKYVVRGDDNQEIAAALSITPNTVKTHLSNIMEKLHFRNRVEVAVYAVGEGIVDYRSECKNDAGPFFHVNR
jgi:DNA-binding NarL/FixJ family response regulator